MKLDTKYCNNSIIIDDFLIIFFKKVNQKQAIISGLL